MERLKNQRLEVFAGGIANGLPLTEAATQAGFSPRMIRSKGSQMLRRPDVQRRVMELRGIMRPTSEEEAKWAGEALAGPPLKRRIMTELWGLLGEAKEAKDRRVSVSVLGELATLGGLRITKIDANVKTSALDEWPVQSLMALRDALDDPQRMEALMMSMGVVDAEPARGADDGDGDPEDGDEGAEGADDPLA